MNNMSIFNVTKSKLKRLEKRPRVTQDVSTLGSFFKTKKPRIETPHFFSGKSACSPTWYGDTTPEIDEKTGGFTGKLVVSYNDPVLKDPCVRECVEVHEKSHVEDLQPLVKKIHDCDVAAGDDWDKKGKCSEMSNKELPFMVNKSECKAYRKSYSCLTLKLLDSNSPCSKSPHKEKINEHRQSEACELKERCTAAGTPHEGIPVS